MIQNYPESTTAGNPQGHILPAFDPEGYTKAKALWLQKVQENEESAVVNGNAAKFLLQSDRLTAEELLKKAQLLEPANSTWC